MSAGVGIKAFLGAGVVRLLGASWRIEAVGKENVERARRSGRPVIYAFWHGRFLPLVYWFRNQNVQVATSEHRDGELIGRVNMHMGIGHVPGSSTRGGVRVIRVLVRRINDGLDAGFAVDGPTGPALRVKPGIIDVARLTGATIIPLATSSSRRTVLSSWDGFEIPHPFARVRVALGEPLRVARGLGADGLESARLDLEKRLTEMMAEHDRAVRKR